MLERKCPTLNSLRANVWCISQSCVFLCNVGLHLSCFLPSGELWSEIIQHSASLTPCSLHTQTKPATAPTVHERPYTQVPMWLWVLASRLTHTYVCTCLHTPDVLDRLWKECEITLHGLLLTPTLDELKGCWLLNLKWYEWSGVCVCSLRLCVICLCWKVITGVNWFSAVKTYPSLNNYKVLFLIIINCYSFSGQMAPCTVILSQETKRKRQETPRMANF